MNRNTFIRQVVFVCVATVAYYAILGLVRDSLPSATIPTWWRALWSSSHIGVVSWLSAMDVVSAFASAVVVAVASIVVLKTNRGRVGIVIGVFCATYVAISATVAYGPFSSGSAIVVLVIQFVALSLAIPLTIKLIELWTLAIGSKPTRPDRRAAAPKVTRFDLLVAVPTALLLFCIFAIATLVPDSLCFATAWACREKPSLRPCWRSTRMAHRQLGAFPRSIHKSWFGTLQPKRRSMAIPSGVGS